MSAIHIFSVKDVPLFLQETEFFRSLDKDDDVITLPKHVCKFDTTIATTDQAISCLSTMRFWGVTKPPVELIKFVLTNPAKEMTELLGGFSKELKQVQWLQEVCRRIHTKNVPSVESFSPHEVTSFTYGIIGLLCEQHRRTGQVWCPEVCALAAHFSWEAGLAFLHERGFPWDESTCAQAARSGSLRCLSYARDHNFPWDVRTVNLAMIGGHRECLAYAVSHNCPRPPRFAWLSSCGPALGAWNEETCAKFAFAGQLHALKFAHENGCPWDKNVIIQACLKGNLPCFLYAVENDCPGKEDACLLIAGWYPQWEETSRPDDWMSNLSKGLQDVFGDNFHTPPSALHNECPTDADVARTGNPPKHNRTLWMELARRHGCPWDKRIFQVVAQSAHHDVFQYALDNGCPGRDEVVIAAARNWSALQYVVFRGCPLLPEAYVSAATSDEPLKAVKFLHARGCPWDERACTAFAKFKRHGCLRFAHANGAPWDATAPAAAARLLTKFFTCPREKQERQSLACLRFLHESGCLWDVSTVEQAEKSFNQSCLQYARQHGCSSASGVKPAARPPPAQVTVVKQQPVASFTQPKFVPTKVEPQPYLALAKAALVFLLIYQL